MFYRRECYEDISHGERNRWQWQAEEQQKPLDIGRKRGVQFATETISIAKLFCWLYMFSNIIDHSHHQFTPSDGRGIRTILLGNLCHIYVFIWFGFDLRWRQVSIDLTTFVLAVITILRIAYYNNASSINYLFIRQLIIVTYLICYV